MKPFRHIRIVLLALVLAACGAQPHPTLWGGERHEVSRNGRHYVVFRKGDLVEVIRLGWASPGQHAQIRATMVALIPEVTGCSARESSLNGDSAEIRGRLRCRG
jgi:hypothetical protein